MKELKLYKQIEIAVEKLKQGEIIIFPTDTVYGVGCDISNENAIRKVFLAKGRDFRKPLAAHVANFEQIEMVAYTEHPLFLKLYEAFLPGPLAIILPKKDFVSDLVTGGFPTISIRFPDCFESIELARMLGRPLSATSANPSGLPAPSDSCDIDTEFVEKVSFVIDSGKTKYQIESTIIDLTFEKPTIRRVGVISVNNIEKLLGIHLEILQLK